MKLYVSVATSGKPVGFPQKLVDARSIAEYVVEHSPQYVDEELIEENYFGCHAVLKQVPISSLQEGDADHNKKSPAKEKKYSEMRPSTCPPILVENSVVQDGNHRFRAAKKRGDINIWIYEVQE